MLKGIWIPIVTPFKDGSVDYESYKQLINYYINQGVSGIIPLGTTGESPAISEYEFQMILETTMATTAGRVPVYVGLGGNHTQSMLNKLKLAEAHKVDGILSVCPYYNRPSQKGIYEHFKAISEATDLNIVLYNIPYRTGRNIENTTLYKLAEFENIVGLKDSCGDIKQTTSLLLNRPKNFSILTGEDDMFYTSLVNGADGGITASAHIHTAHFIKIYELIQLNNHHAALEKWKKIHNFIPLLFQEPNPAPVKYCLKSLGLLQSSELRLPLTDISNELKESLDLELKIRTRDLA